MTDQDDLMTCDECHKQVPSVTTQSCMAEYLRGDVRDKIETALGENGKYLLCSEGLWYCEGCLNKNGYCHSCDKRVARDIQTSNDAHSV